MNPKKILKELDECKNPIFFYDDDADGLCSFLQLYGYKKEGRGICVKTKPLDNKLIRKIDEYGADKVFILDVAVVSDDFFDNVKVPIVWIDHHPNKKKNNIIMYNPLLENLEATPVSGLTYDIVKNNLWIAVTGMISDWVYPKTLVKKFRKDFPGLLPSTVRTPEKALFETDIGKLTKILNFILKGNNNDVRKRVNVLTRIKDPLEILNQTTPQGKFIYKKYLELSKEYNSLLNQAISCVKKNDKFIIFKYRSNQSITSLLSNELLYRFPNKIIIVVRDSQDYFKGSLRSPKKIIINKILDKALVNVDGRGGGHDHACGIGIKKESWDLFLEQLRTEVKMENKSKK